MDLSYKWIFTILAAFSFVILILVTKNVKRCLLLLLVISIPLNFDISLISRDYTGKINSIFLNLVDISVVGLILLLLDNFKSKTNSNEIRIDYFRRITYPATFIVVSATLTLLITNDKTLSVYGIIHVFKLFILYFVVANSLRTMDELKYVMGLLVLSFFFQAVVYIFQVYTGIDFDIMGQQLSSSVSGGLLRPRGLMGQANSAGTFFASNLFLTMSWYLLQMKRSSKVLTCIVFAFGFSALIFTYSRGSWLSFLIAGSIWIVIGIRRKWLNIKNILFLFAAIAIFICIFGRSITLRLTYDKAAESRIDSMMLTWKMIKDHPFLGVGINTYRDEYANYRDLDNMPHALTIVHNQYLLVWAERGIIGLFSFVWFLFAIFREGKKLITSKYLFQNILTAGIITSLLSLCLSMMTQPADKGAVPILIWFLSGYIAACSKLSKRTHCL